MFLHRVTDIQPWYFHCTCGPTHCGRRCRSRPTVQLRSISESLRSAIARDETGTTSQFTGVYGVLGCLMFPSRTTTTAFHIQTTTAGGNRDCTADISNLAEAGAGGVLSTPSSEAGRQQ